MILFKITEKQWFFN